MQLLIEQKKDNLSETSRPLLRFSETVLIQHHMC